MSTADQNVNPPSLQIAADPKSPSFKLMMLRAASSLVPRGLLARLSGGSFGGRRDYYEVFGWDRTVDSRMMWDMYNRGGIAQRIVHAYPDDIWGSPPEPKETVPKAWKNAWEQLVDDHNIWAVLHRLEVLTGMGQYAVLLVGTDDSQRLETPLQEGAATRVLFMQPFSDRSAVITRWGDNPMNERFGLPIEYTIYPGIAQTEDGRMGPVGSVTSNPNRGSFKVHWTRIVHVCKGQLESDVFGTPDLWSIWNYLTDLNKVVGGSSESYWQTANRGMHADLDREMELDPADEAALSEEIEEYHQGLRRFIRTRGVKVTNLGSDVANPEGPFKTLINLISGARGIPQRILLGSEAAHNASTQDKGNWAIRVENHRALVSQPQFLSPLVKALTRMGVLPKVQRKKLEWEWPTAYRASPLELAQETNQKATAANNYGLALKNVNNLMGRQEYRSLIGLEPDDKGDDLEINLGTSPNDQPAADGNTPKTGGGDGNSATPMSDTNGSGDPAQAQK